MFLDFHNPAHSDDKAFLSDMKPLSESDDLQPEYDINSLRLRKTGPGRKAFGSMVALEPDVAAVFDSPEAVNAALRLIKVTKDNASGVSFSPLPRP